MGDGVRVCAGFFSCVFFVCVFCAQVVLEIARLIREDFLQQNAFTDYDYTCPLYKSLGMLKVCISYNRQDDLANVAVRTHTPENVLLRGSDSSTCAVV